MTARSPEAKARKLERAREKRRLAREALGFTSKEAFRLWAAAQAVKTRMARQAKRPVNIEPSAERRQAAQVNTTPGETVEAFLARGGRVDVLPGFQNRPGPIPARHHLGTGARAL